MPATPIISNNIAYDTSIKTIHVLVALCDNKYQGIVPVPAKIGNGQDTENNLYWGCSYGVREYFKKSSKWQLIQKVKVDSIILERVVFKHKTKNCYLIADAYNGKEIKKCTNGFFKSNAGSLVDVVKVDSKHLGANGNANLICYIGHDGLMDFSLPDEFVKKDNKKRDCMMLACYSKSYFGKLLKKTESNPLLWSTGLMSPEAYTLHDAIESYLNNENNEVIRMAGARAYAKYQKCSQKAAANLLVTGW